MTETLVSTSNPYEPVSARTAGSVGQAVKGVEVSQTNIVANCLNITPKKSTEKYKIPRKNHDFYELLSYFKARINKEGVIEVRSPSCFKGYLNLPEKTKQEFTADGFFITGDMGEIDEKG